MSALSPLFVHAQSILGNTATLVLDPEFPEPQSLVTISLDAYSLDTVGATISWFVDGKELVESRNNRSISQLTGVIGTSMTVRASVRLQNGTIISAERVLTPTLVDLVIEADTYIPPFFRGRALPSEQSPLRITAIPHLGQGIDSSTLTYKWQEGVSVLLGGPVKGKQTIEMSAPRFIGSTIRVTVFDTRGKAVAQKTLPLTLATPEVHFYEDNTLRGLNENALTSNFTLVGDESTIHGEPYFMNFINTRLGRYEWKLNNAPAINQNTDQHTLTLRRAGGSGSARVDLRVLTATQIPQYTQGSFTINF